jgi:hypothetical protein
MAVMNKAKSLSICLAIFILALMVYSCAGPGPCALPEFYERESDGVSHAAQAHPVAVSAGEAKHMVCSLPDQYIYFFEGGRLVNIMRCSTGLNDRTPTGNFAILNHHRTHGVIWGEISDYWLGFTSSHGIHAWPRKAAGDFEVMLGSPASPGCIIVHPMEAHWPYYWAPDGTPLTVTRSSLSERVMAGCHACAGASAPSEDWYFAEGYTAGGFDTYLLLANPAEEVVEAAASFFTEGGETYELSLAIAPHSRFTLPVDDLPVVGSTSFAMEVHAGKAIVAERAMYFKKDHIAGGHACAGASAPSEDWYFAEGCTKNLFQTYLLIGNPGDREALVDVDFSTSGESTRHSYRVGPRERLTVDVNAEPGLRDKDVSFTLHSTAPIVAERSLYYDLDSRRGGHSTLGAACPSTNWYFAEGYTDEAFDTYLLFANPGWGEARVEVYFQREDGSTMLFSCTVPAQRRFTLHVDDLPGMERTAFSAHVSSDLPTVAERATYFVLRR